eukprot:CAMPEP_0179133638 /NCGR_PEP_ID=MMETSP0796-20121207/63557_1 /TAXON_ID=73915 /ORGANISM="Pyrodinium bahamense, Strain pbaha01" /LENGTH=483 /DNA_ID=CAMNT_0020832603 /DNA_START=15 /DNA_END=1467 /DNA_ORIENTATION=-
MAAQNVQDTAAKEEAMDVMAILKKLLLCLVYIAVSSLLIRFNSWMMHEDHFPFAMALSTIHMLVCSTLCIVLYSIAPSMYPAMEGTIGRRLDLMAGSSQLALASPASLNSVNHKGHLSVSVLSAVWAHRFSLTTQMAAQTAQGTAAEEKVMDVMACLKKFLLCLLYIAVSTLLIRFNSWMMHADHFPFAMALSTIHMLVCSTLCIILYSLAPSMYPAMESTVGRRWDLMRWFLPIGACFAIMLYGSNKAYAYCSVALLQFMKEANVMVVFLISCAVGLQPINRLRVLLIVWVLISAGISVTGDLTFSLVGIAFQVASQLAECLRTVLGEFVLSGQKLDPLTYTTFVAPVCLLVLLVANLFHWDPRVWPAFVQLWPIILCNAGVAFILNVLVAAVIKEVSAVGFVLTGLTKDVVIVMLSWLFFGDPITATQWSAFLMTLLGVGVWSLMKINPTSPIIQMLESAVCMNVRNNKPTEATALIEKKV